MAGECDRATTSAARNNTPGKYLAAYRETDDRQQVTKWPPMGRISWPPTLDVD
jgi:hypothetical protein